MKRTAASTHGPLQGKWGDYVTVKPHPRRPTALVASGFTLQGGQDRRNVEPRGRRLRCPSANRADGRQVRVVTRRTRNAACGHACTRSATETGAPTGAVTGSSASEPTSASTSTRCPLVTPLRSTSTDTARGSPGVERCVQCLHRRATGRGDDVPPAGQSRRHPTDARGPHTGEERDEIGGAECEQRGGRSAPTATGRRRTRSAAERVASRGGATGRRRSTARGTPSTRRRRCAAGAPIP